MVSVDTNVLIRLMAEDDATQLNAARDFIRQPAWISHLVLMETIWVLSTAYKRSSSELVKAVEILLSHINLSIQEPDVVGSALILFKQKPSLGFSDCMILEIARKAGHLPLGTFDKNLAKIDGAEQI